MKTPNDQKTPDLLPEHDLAGERPRKPTKKELAAARAKRFKESHGVHAVTLFLPVDLAIAFDAYCIARNLKKSDVVAKLLSSQLLRKR